MSTAVTTPQNFEERLIDKLKSDIGSLMTDEELKKMVERAMEKIFFADRVVGKKPGYYGEDVKEPAAFVATVKELLAPRLEAAFKEWLNEHPEEVQKCIDLAFKSNFVETMFYTVNRIVAPAFNQLQVQTFDLMVNHRKQDHNIQS